MVSWWPACLDSLLPGSIKGMTVCNTFTKQLICAKNHLQVLKLRGFYCRFCLCRSNDIQVSIKYIGVSCAHFQRQGVSGNEHKSETQSKHRLSHRISQPHLTTAKQNMWTGWRHQMETFSALLALCGGEKKTSKLHVTGLCVGNSPVTGEFPTQRASNVEDVSNWLCHHGLYYFQYSSTNVLKLINMLDFCPRYSTVNLGQTNNTWIRSLEV